MKKIICIFIVEILERTMRKLLTLSLFLLSAQSLISQVDKDPIAFIAYWSEGDSYDFKVTKISQTWNNELLIKKDSSQYVANFLVLEENENSYKIQWSYRNQLFSSFQENLKRNNDDIEIMSSIPSKYDTLSIIYKTSELGEFLEIENWKEISDLIIDLFHEIEQGLGSQNPESTEEIKNVMTSLLEIYSSKEGIEQLVLKDLQYFHSPFGYEYDTADTIKYEQELPNMLGGEPIKCLGTINFEEIDLANSFCVLREELIINPDDTKRLTIQLLKNLGFDNNNIDEVFHTAVFDILDLNLYEYYFYPGVPHSIYGSRKIIVEVNEERNEKLDELIIELIYDE